MARSGKLTWFQKIQIIQLRVGGMKVRDVAEEMELCTSTVENVLKAHGITKESMVKAEDYRLPHIATPGTPKRRQK